MTDKLQPTTLQYFGCLNNTFKATTSAQKTTVLHKETISFDRKMHGFNGGTYIFSSD